MLTLLAAAAALLLDPVVIEPQIRARTTGGMAPLAVHVNGVDSDPGAGTLVTSHLSWDFGDPEGDYNQLSGFNAAHVYDQPGQYTLQLALTNQQGQQQTTQLTIDVTPARRQIIHVSPAGSDRKDGATPATAMRTLAMATRRLRDNCEIRLERGGSYTVSQRNRIKSDNVLIGAYGEGPKPIVFWSGDAQTTSAVFEVDASAKHVIIQDLQIRSPHSPSRKLVRGVNVAGQDVTVRRCQFQGVSYAVRAAVEPRGVLTVRNQAAVIGAYFVWGQGTDHCHLGNTVEGSFDEHNMRFVAERILLADNDLTNTKKRTIWCMTGRHASIIGNRLQDGLVMIGPRPEDAGHFRQAIFEGNTLDRQGVILRHGAEQVRLSNNIVRFDGGVGLNVWGYDENQDRTCRQIHVINNTFVNRKTRGSAVAVGTNAEDVTIANNIFFAPNLETGRRRTANAWVVNDDLGSIRFVSNLWSEPASARLRGWHYLSSDSTGAAAFTTPEAWSQLAGVELDRYRDFTPGDIDSQGLPTFPVDFGQPVAGLHVDFTGRMRQRSETVAVGAVVPAETRVEASSE